MDNTLDNEDLLTVREFLRLNKDSTKIVDVYTRFGEFLGSYDIKESIRRFGHRKLYNFCQYPSVLRIYICAQT